MKRLFESADEFLRRSTWRDMAALKFCLLALGILLGTKVPRKRRFGVRLLARLVFILTCIPLMGKYIGVLMGMQKRELEEDLV